ncbi:MAG TPA: zinc finger domain-containing protein [Thermoplasmata archaeon]|nr:zinc finger domain-containing protein [Thermoplasmata archaeon]
MRRPVTPDESRCSSCGAVLSGKGTTVFSCPSCGQSRIGRCGRCRDQSVAYRCPACSFMGP